MKLFSYFHKNHRVQILLLGILTITASGILLHVGTTALACGFEDQYSEYTDPFGTVTCGEPGGGGSSYSVAVTANPTAIQSGQATLVSWTTTGYTDSECTMDTQYTTNNNSWTNQTPAVGIVANGSKTDYPSYTTEYHVHCSTSYTYTQACGNTNCSVTTNIDRDGYADVNVTGAPALVASCSVNPTSITTGGSATWSANASGGNGSYTYSWTGTDGLSGTSATVTKTYPTAGTKTGSVTVTSGSQSVTQACGNGLTVNQSVDGTCGSANGTSVGTAPSSGLCSTGNASAVSGSGPWTWSCVGTFGGATASCSANKQVVAMPDLTAGGVSPSTATAGTAVTLSATITNTGTGSTGAGFTDLFQRATDSSGSGATDIGTYSNGALAASGSNAASLSYTFASAGTYYVRTCADKASAGDAGAIAESNENNNCGAWTAVTVAPVVQPIPTCTLTSGAPTVPTTLSWSSTNATRCTGGGFSTGDATGGSIGISTAGGYTLSCTGSGGACSASTNVGAAACTNATGTLTASPNRIQPGQSTTLTYSASGITTSCTLTGPGVNQTYSAASCTVPNGTVPTGALSTQATYILTCDGTERARTIVNVVPKFIEF